MRLKMNYNTFVKLKDFSKLIDISAEILNYVKKNDILEGELIINGKYLKLDGINETFFNETLPFSIVFKSSDYEINDIMCSDIETISVDGRGIDIEFDITVNYEEFVINEELVRNDEIALPMELGKIESNDLIEELEEVKTLETKKVDSLLKQTLNYKDDNLPTQELVVKGFNEESSRIKVCYFKEGKLDEVCEATNHSLIEILNENKKNDIDKYHRVIVSGFKH